MMLGNKKIFAIEMEKDETYPHKDFAKVRIFIKDLYLGYFNTVAYLSAFLPGVEDDIGRLELLPSSCRNMTPEEVFIERFDGRDQPDYREEIDHFNIISDETFDDFSILAYKLNSEKMTIVWRLDGTNYEYKNYPKGIHSAILNIINVQKVLQDAQEFIEKNNW